MPIDTQTPGEPGWWLKRLAKKLGDQQKHYDLLDGYMDGRNAIPVNADKEVRAAYERLMRISRTNFAELIVEAVRERMQPVGFRTGAAGDELGDAEAWRIWQANSLDADSALVHEASLSMGLAYTIIGGVDEEIEAPLITAEDPREVIVETDPRRRRKVLAGLKVFRDDVEGLDRAYLYLPGQVWRAAHQYSTSETSIGLDSIGSKNWEWVGDADTLDHQVVPVVPFPNRPKLGRMVTRGEFETHRPILDRINYTVLQRVEIATLQAFRQRALKGGPTHDENGDEIDYDEIFDMEPGAIWHIPESAELWESGQVDLSPIRQAIRDDVQDLCAATRTPLFYISPDAANGSAEGASLAREGLIFKTTDRLVEAGEAWEQTMAIAFLQAGDDVRARRADMEIMWASPERRSLNERADAGIKALAGGLSRRAVLEQVWAMTPQQIEKVESDLMAEALMSQGVAAATALVTDETDSGRQPAAG